MSALAMVSGFRRVVEKMVDLLTWVAVLLLIPMMFLVTADVIGRYLLNSPIPAVFEIDSYFIMVAVVFFPLAYVQRRKEHINITLFTERIPARGKAFLEAVSLLTGMFCFGLIGFYSMQRAILATRVHEYISGVVDIPIWIAKWIIPIGCFVFCIQLLLDILDHIAAIFGSGTSGKEVANG